MTISAFTLATHRPLGTHAGCGGPLHVAASRIVCATCDRAITEHSEITHPPVRQDWPKPTTRIEWVEA